MPIVVNNFTLYYSHANSRAKLPTSMKKIRETKKPKMVAVSPTFNAIPDVCITLSKTFIVISVCVGLIDLRKYTRSIANHDIC